LGVCHAFHFVNRFAAPPPSPINMKVRGKSFPCLTDCCHFVNMIEAHRPDAISSSLDYSWMPSRGVRDRSPPWLLAKKADAGAQAVSRGGRTRKVPAGREDRATSQVFI